MVFNFKKTTIGNALYNNTHVLHKAYEHIAKATNTELCGFSYAESAYTNDAIRSLYDRLIDACFNNLLNVDSVVQRTFSTNTAIPKHTLGLKDIILNSILSHESKFYEVLLVDNTYVQYKEITKKNFKGEVIANEDALVIKGDVFKTRILHSYYALQYRYIGFINLVLKLQNKPILKIASFSKDNSTIDESAIVAQAETFMNYLKSPEGFGLMDKDSDLLITQIDIEKYKELLNNSFALIAQHTGLPKAYIMGSSAGALNSTGEGDRIQYEEVLFKIYTDFIANILKRVYSLIGKTFDVKYHEYTKHKIKEISDLAISLNGINFISEETKKNILQEMFETISK